VTGERHITPAFPFDLDGTLIDSVYQHVIAWRGALEHGRAELFYSGAFRVYEDPAELLAHLDEVGVRRAL
jgi:beta-phosphoglucomutase-like phosphatase (HAD superfamily)